MTRARMGLLALPLASALMLAIPGIAAATGDKDTLPADAGHSTTHVESNVETPVDSETGQNSTVVLDEFDYEMDAEQKEQFDKAMGDMESLTAKLARGEADANDVVTCFDQLIDFVRDTGLSLDQIQEIEADKQRALQALQSGQVELGQQITAKATKVLAADNTKKLPKKISAGGL